MQLQTIIEELKTIRKRALANVIQEFLSFFFQKFPLPLVIIRISFI